LSRLGKVSLRDRRRGEQPTLFSKTKKKKKSSNGSSDSARRKKEGLKLLNAAGAQKRIACGRGKRGEGKG